LPSDLIEWQERYFYANILIPFLLYRRDFQLRETDPFLSSDILDWLLHILGPFCPVQAVCYSSTSSTHGLVLLRTVWVSPLYLILGLLHHDVHSISMICILESI